MLIMEVPCYSTLKTVRFMLGTRYRLKVALCHTYTILQQVTLQYQQTLDQASVQEGTTKVFVTLR